MALRIQRREWKNQDGTRTSTWRLVVEEWVGEDRARSLYPPKARYANYGLNPNDSYEVALEKLKVVRAHREIERRKKHQAKIERRQQDEILQESAYLPAPIYLKFLEWLKSRRLWEEIPRAETYRLRTMRRLIMDLDVAPSVWSDQPELVYRWFMNKKLSVSSVEKIIPFLNEYGFFYCKEFEKPFLRIPMPRQSLALKIDEVNFKARGGKTKISKPLNPKLLSKLKDLPEPQERWLRMSVWFGLRPAEIDRIKPSTRDTHWRITYDQKKVPVLRLYQAKLVKLARARRWKMIPAILPEHRQLIDELEDDQKLKSTLTRKLQDLLGEGFGVYAGRKGFEKLMRELGQEGVDVSRWLGHQNVQRTDSNYRELEVVNYKPVLRLSRKSSKNESDSHR